VHFTLHEVVTIPFLVRTLHLSCTAAARGLFRTRLSSRTSITWTVDLHTRVWSCTYSARCL